MKDIKGYEGVYAITSCGKVWSYRSQKFLKEFLSYGYSNVKLIKDGVRENRRVHRLVAEAYIANPENKPQVNHKDENKTNNSVNNLEWMTSKENINYGTRTQRTWKAVRCVEKNIIYKSLTEAHLATGVSISSISQCCKGNLKTAGGYHWEFINKEVAANVINN